MLKEKRFVIDSDSDKSDINNGNYQKEEILWILGR